MIVASDTVRLYIFYIAVATISTGETIKKPSTYCERLFWCASGGSNPGHPD